MTAFLGAGIRANIKFHYDLSVITMYLYSFIVQELLYDLPLA